MTTLSPDALSVSLVQAATIVPTFLLALPAGALADIVDRRRFLIATQCGTMLAAVLIAAPLVRADPPTAVQNNRANRGPRHALDRPLPDVKFNAVALSDVIDFLADTSGANFAVDWKQLDAAHVAKDAPITLKMGGSVPLRKVLTLVLKQAAADAPLTYYVDDGVIQVTTQEAADKELISKTYGIQDLLFQPIDATGAPQLDLQSASQGSSAGGGGGGGGSGGGQSLFSGSGNQQQNQTADSQKDRADEIIKLITDSVKPELWQVNGGTATISYYRGMLIVNAPRSIHEMLESH